MCLQVNHHFRKNNSYYDNIEHPRWGAIQSVVISKSVQAGEELFTYYGYRNGHGYKFPSDFPWYWELKRQVEKEERVEAKRAKLKKKIKYREMCVRK